MENEIHTIPAIVAEYRSLGIIYIATNSVNGKRYVGQARDFEDRKKAHFKSIEKYEYRSRFVPALRKHGWDAFRWELVCECLDQQELDDAERFYIKLWKTQDPNHGYNIAPGGVGRTGPCSEEHRRRLSEMRKRVLSSPEKREEIASKLRGVPLTEERKRNISKSKQNTSEATRQKMREAWIKRKAKRDGNDT